MKVGANQSCPLPGLLTCALLRAQDVKRKSCKLANCTAKARGCNPCLFINLNTWENLFITRHEVAKKRGLIQKRKCERTVSILLRSSRRTIHTQRRRFEGEEEDRRRKKQFHYVPCHVSGGFLSGAALQHGDENSFVLTEDVQSCC